MRGDEKLQRDAADAMRLAVAAMEAYRANRAQARDAHFAAGLDLPELRLRIARRVRRNLQGRVLLLADSRRKGHRTVKIEPLVRGFILGAGKYMTAVTGAD